MRILYIVPYVPSRIRVRPLELIRHLAHRGHEVTVATLWNSREEESQIEKIVPFTKHVIARGLRRSRSLANCARATVSGSPLQARYCWQPDLARDIQHAFDSQRFDVVHVEHMRGACYGLRLKARTRGRESSCPFVWDSVDCISHLFEQTVRRSVSLKWRMLARMELSRTRRCEAKFAEAFGNVVVTSAADAGALKNLVNGNGKTSGRRQPTLHVVPMGVDAEHFKVEHEPQASPTIVFVGKMSYHANISAAAHLVCDLMPAVWRTRPDVRVYLVGQDPPGQVTRLARERPSQVVVTGTVDDIRGYLRRSTVAVAPMTYATGMQSKVLEYMAAGIPVVASPKAVSALTVVPGREVLVAESAVDFARYVLDLIDRPERANQTGLQGRRYVEENHSWQRSAQELETVYENAR